MNHSGWRRLFSHGAGEAGSTLVEFAVAAPILIFFLLAIVDFGRAFYDYDLIANDARLGTRYAMVRGLSCTYVGCPASISSVQDYVQSVTTGIDPKSVAVMTSWHLNPSSTDCTAAQYPVGVPPNGQSCIVQVVVSYNFYFAVIPFTGPYLISSSAQNIITQ